MCWKHGEGFSKPFEWFDCGTTTIVHKIKVFRQNQVKAKGDITVCAVWPGICSVLWTDLERSCGDGGLGRLRRDETG